jgi:hypothetical protein
MAYRRDYIPKPNADFDAWFRNLADYVNKKCRPPDAPQWSHIPGPALEELNAAYAAWRGAYEITLKPCTKPDRDERKRIRGVSEKTVRGFVNIYLRYHPAVTREDKENMGLFVPGGARGPIIPPKEGPVFHIIQLGPRLLGIVYQDGERRKGSRPPGCRRARIYYGVFDGPPADQEQLPASTWATRCPHVITFRETDRGKRAWFALKWELDKEHGESPWSEMQSEIIP